MIKLLGKVPHKINIAFSGGVDSLVAAHFFKQGKKDVTLMHFNHGCQYSSMIQTGCEFWAKELDLPMVVGHISNPTTPQGRSKEEYWRAERYDFLTATDVPTVTCHHLDDAMETWVWSSLHGNGTVIPYSRQNIIRPFLLTAKQELIRYSNKYHLMPIPDPFNSDMRLTRNYIRANLMPHIEFVNPGLDKVIRKKYLNSSTVQ